MNLPANATVARINAKQVLAEVIPTPVDSFFDDDKILNFKGDPDDDGFVPYSKNTLDRAKRFLSAYTFSFAKRSSFPNVLPGPAGSIDIHWKSEKRELLVNIPADSNLPATFYGDDYDKNFIKGAAKIGTMEEPIAYWLLS